MPTDLDIVMIYSAFLLFWLTTLNLIMDVRYINTVSTLKLDLLRLLTCKTWTVSYAKIFLFFLFPLKFPKYLFYSIFAYALYIN